jgi:hypothetical protein
MLEPHGRSFQEAGWSNAEEFSAFWVWQSVANRVPLEPESIRSAHAKQRRAIAEAVIMILRLNES